MDTLISNRLENKWIIDRVFYLRRENVKNKGKIVWIGKEKA